MTPNRITSITASLALSMLASAALGNSGTGVHCIKNNTGGDVNDWEFLAKSIDPNLMFGVSAMGLGGNGWGGGGGPGGSFGVNTAGPNIPQGGNLYIKLVATGVNNADICSLRLCNPQWTFNGVPVPVPPGQPDPRNPPAPPGGRGPRIPGYGVMPITDGANKREFLWINESEGDLSLRNVQFWSSANDLNLASLDTPIGFAPAPATFNYSLSIAGNFLIPMGSSANFVFFDGLLPPPPEASEPNAIPVPLTALEFAQMSAGSWITGYGESYEPSVPLRDVIDADAVSLVDHQYVVPGPGNVCLLGLVGLAARRRRTI